jgi:hypothetical protein
MRTLQHQNKTVLLNYCFDISQGDLNNSSKNKNTYLLQLILIIFLIGFTKLNAQNNTTLSLQEGMTIESTVYTYKTPLLIDPLKWVKTKDEKKEAAVDKFNADVAAGLIAPATTGTLPLVVNKKLEEDGMLTYNCTATIGASGNNNIKIQQKGDTVYYLFNDAAFYPIVDAKGDTIGMNYYSAKTFPVNMQVGDIIPGHLSEMNLFPYDFLNTSRRYFNLDGGDGYNYSGFVNVRTVTKMDINTITLYTPYTVIGKEEIVISGKSYVAYKMFNAQWTKTTNNSVSTEIPTVYFDDSELSNKIKDYFSDLASKKSYQRAKERIAAKIDKFSMTNEYGYTENLIESWYCPELGMFILARVFDADGAILVETKVTSIK